MPRQSNNSDNFSKIISQKCDSWARIWLCLWDIYTRRFFLYLVSIQKIPEEWKIKKKTMKIYKKMKSQQKNWFKRIQKLWSGILLVLLVDKKHFYTTIKTFLFTIVDQFEFDTAAPHHEKVKAQTEKHTPASQSAEASMLQCGTVCGFKRKACCFRLKSSERTTLCE